ncbi:MAG: hypothetical protein KIT58_01030, partial [Planctomycetota bacterium]|nr:hypothetical protein [Planctomycetota bacterium]
AAVALVFAPEVDLFGRAAAAQQRAQDLERSRRQAEEIQKRTDAARQRLAERASPRTTELLTDLEKIASDLRSGQADRRQGMRQLQQLRDRAKDMARETAPLPQAARPTHGDDATRDLREALGKGDFDKAAGEAERMKQALQEGTTSEQMEQLSQDLRDLSLDVSRNQSLQQAFDRAAQGLQQGRPDEALAGLDKAVDAMRDIANLREQLELMQEMMDSFAETSHGQDPLTGSGDDPQNPLNQVDQRNLDAAPPDAVQSESCSDCQHGRTPGQQQPGQQQQQPGQQQPEQQQPGQQQPGQQQPGADGQQPDPQPIGPQRPAPVCPTCEGVGRIERACSRCKGQGRDAGKLCPGCQNSARSSRARTACDRDGETRACRPVCNSRAVSSNRAVNITNQASEEPGRQQQPDGQQQPGSPATAGRS